MWLLQIFLIINEQLRDSTECNSDVVMLKYGRYTDTQTENSFQLPIRRRHHRRVSRNKAATGVLIFTVGTVTADILIAVSLIWKLVTMKTSFITTSSLIDRLVVGAFQTGSTAWLPSQNLNLQRRDGTSGLGGPGIGPSRPTENIVTDISLGVQFYHTRVVTTDSANGNVPSP
ncbi:hypothetical protein K438DRAFT_1772250 [Mycena galopus ATCC 62051]|nr:hypothetical protein K438DRAFT_1772250 [Mycena galopus ATCC 62051]